MSYVTQDRHGGMATTYANIKSSEPIGTGKTWWPDFGPSTRDHSYQEKYMPHHHIFEKVVKPHTVGKPRGQPLLEREPTQFRHPQPAREHMLLKDQPTNDRRLAAKETTDRQSSLRMMEVRQRQIDSWLEPVPIRMAAAPKTKTLRLSNSEPSLTNNGGSAVAAQVSRDVYEKLGFLVGRSKGSVADGMGGASGSATRKHNSLSLNALMFSGNVVDGNRAATKNSRSALPKKASGQWNLCPESSFVFDPKTSLPVPRGGWNSQPATSWTEPPANGRREWAAPVTFDARPKASQMEALTEWPRSPSAIDRRVTAGSAGASVRKQPYGEVREPGQERQGLGPHGLAATASSAGLGNSGSNFNATGASMGASASPAATQ